jgi:UDP-N-acetyl-D-mannosaminuronic acid dehydrogenase
MEHQACETLIPIELDPLFAEFVDDHAAAAFKSTAVDRQHGVATKTVCIVGLGYIGLPTAAILASRGYQVSGVDVRREVIESVRSGEAHIYEPDLDSLVRAAVRDGKLTASTEPGPADVFMICVPTPVTKNREPDLSFVRQAAASIRPHVRQGNLIILESTSPPQTTERVIAAEAIPPSLTIGRDVFVAYCPERVLPGRILADAVQNDRIVGGVTEACSREAKRFYETFVHGAVFAASSVTAELVKLSENAFRDVNIAFANELAALAERFDADPFEIIKLANRHPRVNILTPGPGVGGHCIPVDPWFLIHAAPDAAKLLRTAREVNDLRPAQVVARVKTLAQQHGISVIGCLGLTYKADVDDLRESPSLEIVRQLREQFSAQVLVCDPLVRRKEFREFSLSSLAEVLDRSDVLVLLTDHAQFREIPPDVLAQKKLVDPRGAWRSTVLSQRPAA